MWLGNRLSYAWRAIYDINAQIPLLIQRHQRHVEILTRPRATSATRRAEIQTLYKSIIYLSSLQLNLSHKISF